MHACSKPGDNVYVCFFSRNYLMAMKGVDHISSPNLTSFNIALIITSAFQVWLINNFRFRTFVAVVLRGITVVPVPARSKATDPGITTLVLHNQYSVSVSKHKQTLINKI